MAPVEIPKLNYDDYYKFMISISLIILILSLGATTVLVYYGLNYSSQIYNYLSGAAIYFIFSVIAILQLNKALTKWRTNQEKLDAKLDAEVSIKLLQARKEAAEYEMQINELVKESHPFPKLDFIYTLKRKNLEKNIDENLKS